MINIKTIYNNPLIKKWWGVLGLVLILLAIGILFFGRSNGQDVLAEVATSTVVETVSVSGETKSSSFVDLAFEQSGTVVSVGAKVGDRVFAGQNLVSLDQGKARADLLSAQGKLDYELARLSEAQVSLSDAERVLDDSLRDSYTKADDAVRNYADKFFKNPNSSSANFEINFTDGNRTLNFEINDFDLERSVNLKKRGANDILDQWKLDLNEPNFYQNKNESIDKTQSNLESIRSLLDDLSIAINSLDTDYFEYRSTIDGYKSNISTARANVNTAINNLTSARSQWNTAKLSAAVSSGGNVSTQSAQIKQAEAQVAEKRALLSKLSLVAPISGVVTKQEAKVGQSVQAGEIVTSIIAPDSFEIEANIPEISISKVKLDQVVEITLDAFRGEVFTGRLFYIDPAETIIDGVVNYKIKVAFEKNDPRLKSGLTANLKITTEQKENVIAVPIQAISVVDGQSFVQKVVDGETVLSPVETGLYGDSGEVEIVSGLSAGDKIYLSK